MRITLRQTSPTTIEVFRGHTLAATIYATPGGITVQAPALDPTDIDIDSGVVHVEIRAA
jgi:hypothetical protein